MEFSRDDQFLLTIGDYSECLVMIWNANNFLCLETFKTIYPIHSAQWHPYIADQFVSVGQKSSVTFWDVKEEKNKITLQVFNSYKLDFLVSMYYVFPILFKNLLTTSFEVCPRSCAKSSISAKSAI